MNTHSDTTRAIHRKQTNTFLVAVMVLAGTFTTGCSMSLVDKTPEILRYCRVAERSDPSDQADTAGQGNSAPANDANAECTVTGDESCSDDAVDRVDRDQQVNCGR